MVTALPGQLMAFSGIVLLLASGGSGSFSTVSYWLMGGGVALIFAGSLRYVQGVRAGRAFRGGRPPVKRSAH